MTCRRPRVLVLGCCLCILLLHFLPLLRFARLAFEEQVPLIPALALNENRVTFQLNIFNGVRRWFLSKIGHAFPTFFIGPFPVPITIRVGLPLKPSDYSCWEELHAAYYRQVLDLVNRYEGLPYKFH